MTFWLYDMVPPKAASVGGPLDRVQIDAVLVHFPERRKIAQLADLLVHQCGRVVDLFLGGEAAEREAYRTVRQFVGAAQSPQHVGRLEARRGAGRAGRNRDLLDRHDQRFAFDEVETDDEIV